MRAIRIPAGRRSIQSLDILAAERALVIIECNLRGLENAGGLSARFVRGVLESQCWIGCRQGGPEASK